MIDALSKMDDRDVFNCAQAHLIVGANFLVSSEVTTATRYIKYAASIIERSPGDFIPPLNSASQSSTPLEPSEEVQERFALIAHIVNCRSLLRIHVLEKKIKTVHADVMNDLPVRIVLTHIPLHRLLTLQLAGSRCAGSPRSSQWSTKRTLDVSRRLFQRRILGSFTLFLSL